MRPLAQAENRDAEHTPLSLFNYFVNRCREKLHVILAFSPIGDAFRSRVRQFPSLINCCTIDWFQAWPDDALGKREREGGEEWAGEDIFLQYLCVSSNSPLPSFLFTPNFPFLHIFHLTPSFPLPSSIPSYP